MYLFDNAIRLRTHMGILNRKEYGVRKKGERSVRVRPPHFVSRISVTREIIDSEPINKRLQQGLLAVDFRISGVL